MLDIHADDPAFGYRFITDELARKGHRACKNRAQRVCQQATGSHLRDITVALRHRSTTSVALAAHSEPVSIGEGSAIRVAQHDD